MALHRAVKGEINLIVKRAQRVEKEMIKLDLIYFHLFSHTHTLFMILISIHKFSSRLKHESILFKYPCTRA
jgi:hypothetical protein